MKKILVLVFGVLFGLIEAQPPTRFYTTFGGSGDDIGYSAKQTFDGQYIIVGSTTSFGSTDVYLLKVDSMGLLIWQKNIGGVNNDVGKSVVQMPDSGFVVAGFTNSFGSGGYDAYLLRTDKNGNTLWQKTFGGANWDFASDLVLTANNKIAVVGHTSSFGSGKKDGMVLLYDFAGNLIWQKFFGGVENEELRAIISTNEGNLATVGYTESKNDINGDGYFLKLNLNGDTLFGRTFGGPGVDYANDIVQKIYGDYLIAGAKTYSNSPFTHGLMFSFSQVGDSMWERHLQKNNENESFQAVTNSPLLPQITAFTRSINFPFFKRQGQIFTTYPNGGYEYQINESGGLEDEYEYSVEPTRDGGYINVGSTRSFGSAGIDIYFIKRDSVVLYYSSIVSISQKKKKQDFYFFSDETSIIVTSREENLDSLEVFDLNGVSLQKKIVHGETGEIDISDLPKAIYLLKIRFSDGRLYFDKFAK